jgi:hypothetical protein
LSYIIYNTYIKTPKNDFKRVNGIPFETGWYIHSHLYVNQKIDDTILSKEESNHQLTFSFQKMDDDIIMQNIDRNILYNEDEIEKLCDKVFFVELKEDNPLILINVSFMN